MTRLQRYEQRVDTPLTLGAVAFLVVYALPILWAGLPHSARLACGATNALLWVAFAADLVVRTVLAPDHLRYLVRHPVDVVIVAVPILRPLRVLRVFTAAQMLMTRGGLLRTGQAIVAAAALLIFVAALAELDAERGAHGANILTFGDSLWWAISTVTTVGYGDVYPVTDTGRYVAAGLMLVGISLVGTITATVAAWFVARAQQGSTQQDGDPQDGDPQDGTQQSSDLARLADDVQRLSAQVQALRDQLGVRDATDVQASPTGGEGVRGGSSRRSTAPE